MHQEAETGSSVSEARVVGVASELERAASRELPSKKPVASFEPTPRELFILITLYPAYAVAEFLTLCLKKKTFPSLPCGCVSAGVTLDISRWA